MVRNLRTIGFQELITFAKVVEQGGITSAAEALGITKSAVSSHISKLEQRLNIKLLNRNSRRVSLTKEGQHLLPRVESLLAEGEQLFREAELEENLPRGLVRIASTPEFAEWMSIQLVPLVTQHYPDIRIVMKTAYNFEDLQDPSFDLAFRINRVQDDRLVAKRLGAFHRFFFAHPELADLCKLSHPTQLTDYPCLAFSDSSIERVWIARHKKDGTSHHIPISAVSAVLNFNVITALACAGQGICNLPSFVATPYLKSGQLVRVLPDWQSNPVDILLAYRLGVDRIARVNAVLGLAKAWLPNLILDQIK